MVSKLLTGDIAQQAQDLQDQLMEGFVRLVTPLEFIKWKLIRGVNPLEDLFWAELDLATINPGASLDPKPMVIKDVWNRQQPFSHLSITQVDVAAIGLAVTDSLDVRLYRSGNPSQNPLDVCADFYGASQLTDVWYASFSNRRIEYHPRDHDPALPGLLWVVVTNASATKADSVRVTVYGRRFPIYPVVPTEADILAQLQALEKAK